MLCSCCHPPLPQLACFWRLTVDLEDFHDDRGQRRNWMTVYEFVAQPAYFTALYWSVMTLTTIGYGDVAPVTLGEQLICIFAMLLGGSIYAYVIGAVCGIVSSMDEATTEYHKVPVTCGAVCSWCAVQQVVVVAAEASSHVNFVCRQWMS